MKAHEETQLHEHSYWLQGKINKHRIQAEKEQVNSIQITTHQVIPNSPTCSGYETEAIPDGATLESTTALATTEVLLTKPGHVRRKPNPRPKIFPKREGPLTI